MDWDTQLFFAINGLAGHWPWLDGAMRLLSRPWSYIIPGCFAALVWYWKEGVRSIALGVALAALIGLADWTALGVKQVISRPRPCQVLSGVKKVTGCGRAAGFPSNHAVNTAAAAIFLQMIYPRSAVVMWPLVALLGFNRIYVGAHYPTDVLGGWLLGIIDGVAFFFFVRARRWIKFAAAPQIAPR